MVTAGVEKETDRGILDFHAVRKSFVTFLLHDPPAGAQGSAGVEPARGPGSDNERVCQGSPRRTARRGFQYGF